MYWKSESVSEFSALFLQTDHVAEENFLLNNSSDGELYVAISSSCAQVQGHFFYIPANPLELGRVISVHVGNFSRFLLNSALPGVYELSVTISAGISKALSRAFCFCRRHFVLKSCKKRLVFYRPSVLRL